MSELPPTDKTSDDCDLCFIIITPPDWMKQKQGDPSIADPKRYSFLSSKENNGQQNCDITKSHSNSHETSGH